MPSGIVEERVGASAMAVFDLIHDYDRRLEWDTLLREAYLEPPFERAEKGAIAMCRGKWITGGIGVQTEYVTFERGKVAAVKMTNRPPFFESFAASIRHIDQADGGSTIIYKFRFTARPLILRIFLDPIMCFFLRLETRKRLKALKRFIGTA
jgi:hypothetical protein